MPSFFRKRKDTATIAPSSGPQAKSIPCSVCKDLDPHLFEILELRHPRLRIDWENLRQSARNCLSCNLLVKILERELKGHDIAPRGIRLVYDGTMIIEIGSSNEIMLYSDRATPWSSIKVRDHIMGSNYSERSLDYVKRMLQKCSSEHGLCRRQQSVSLPTRLLDLGFQNPVSQNDTIRLWETKNAQDPSKIEYACLSHCWGGHQPLKTLNNNYDEHKKGIGLKTLPRTFLDAIDFTRRLGIRYIWIDSLCIKQDDDLDWKHEAAQMSNVYQNCVICLASPNATNPNSGLYSTHPIHIETVKSADLIPKKSSTPSAEPWSVFARQLLSHSILQDPSDIPLQQSDHDPGTLRFRGWVYQERMLAPRFLHFLEQELAWDCRTLSACECGDQARTEKTDSMGYAKRAFASELQAASPDAMAAVWRTMVPAYTRLYLTHEKDRLPAIAGVAHMLEKARGPASRYCEGIWSDSAVQDLAWEVWWDNKRGESRVRNEMVPSWSWASVSAAIGYPLKAAERFRPLCSIVDMGDADPSPTGPTKRRTLTIHGHVVPAVLEYRGQQAGANSRPYTLRFVGHDKKVGFPEDEFVESSGDGHVPNGGTVYYFLLGKDHLDIYYSLILKELDSRSRTYRRIGLARNGGDVFDGRLKEKTSLCLV